MPESRRFYTLEECREIYELNLKDLKTGVDSRTIKKAKEQRLVTKYQGITRGGILEYKTTAVTTSGVKNWEQQVKLLDLDDAINATKLDNMTDREIVDMIVFGDISVWCECPAWKWWGYQYIAWQLDYGLTKQTIKPDTRNPKRKGTVCKHLYNVFTVMPFHITQIARDLKNLGIM